MLQSLRLGDVLWNTVLLITSLAINLSLLFAVETVLFEYGLINLLAIPDIWFYNFITSAIGSGFVLLSTTIIHTLREYTRINLEYSEAVKQTLKVGIEEQIKCDKKK